MAGNMIFQEYDCQHMVALCGRPSLLYCRSHLSLNNLMFHSCRIDSDLCQSNCWKFCFLTIVCIIMRIIILNFIGPRCRSVPWMNFNKPKSCPLFLNVLVHAGGTGKAGEDGSCVHCMSAVSA